MLENQNYFNTILHTALEILKAEKLNELTDLITKGEVKIDQTGYDNWNGGTYYYTIYVIIDISIFVKIRERVQSIETTLLEKFSITTRHLDNEGITKVTIVPEAKVKINWTNVAGFITKDKLIEEVKFLKEIMISVSTGGQRIQDINDNYKQKYNLVEKVLHKLTVINPNNFNDLWDWYRYWSLTFERYTERRTYINEMYNPLIQVLEETNNPELVTITIDLGDWERIERSINEIRIRQSEASTEEQFQVIGLLSRETIITLAQAVYVVDKHPILDGKEISKTDAKRMLDAYIAVELAGSSNETLRKYAKATLELANELTHKRTASKKDASICATATISIINLIGTLEGRI